MYRVNKEIMYLNNNVLSIEELLKLNLSRLMGWIFLSEWITYIINTPSRNENKEIINIIQLKVDHSIWCLLNFRLVNPIANDHTTINNLPGEKISVPFLKKEIMHANKIEKHINVIKFIKIILNNKRNLNA